MNTIGVLAIMVGVVILVVMGAGSYRYHQSKRIGGGKTLLTHKVMEGEVEGVGLPG